MTPEELDAIEARAASDTIDAYVLREWNIPALVAEVRRLREAIEQSTCPHPILGDETVRDCVNHGHCGCGNLAALKGDDFAIKYHQEHMGEQS